MNEYSATKRKKMAYGYVEVGLAEVKADAAQEVKSKTKAKAKAKEQEKSKLHPQVQELIKFICNMQNIEKSVIEIGYDPKKLPLGQLSDETIKKGGQCLKDIETAIEKKQTAKLADLSNEFYKIIPHDFGFKNMSNFIIKTKDDVANKMRLVQSLKDIAVTAKISKTDESSSKNEIDQKYEKLNCDIKALDEKSQKFKFLCDYINKSQGSTHASHKCLEIFEIS